MINQTATAPTMSSGSAAWSFSLRHGYEPDSSDDETSSQTAINPGAETEEEVDLSARQDTVQYNPNPWSISKINAALRPAKEPVSPATAPVVKKKPKPIVEAFKQQARKPASSKSKRSPPVSRASEKKGTRSLPSVIENSSIATAALNTNASSSAAAVSVQDKPNFSANARTWGDGSPRASPASLLRSRTPPSITQDSVPVTFETNVHTQPHASRPSPFRDAPRATASPFPLSADTVIYPPPLDTSRFESARRSPSPNAYSAELDCEVYDPGRDFQARSEGRFPLFPSSSTSTSTDMDENPNVNANAESRQVNDRGGDDLPREFDAPRVPISTPRDTRSFDVLDAINRIKQAPPTASFPKKDTGYRHPNDEKFDYEAADSSSYTAYDDSRNDSASVALGYAPQNILGFDQSDFLYAGSPVYNSFNDSTNDATVGLLQYIPVHALEASTPVPTHFTQQISHPQHVPDSNYIQNRRNHRTLPSPSSSPTPPPRRLPSNALASTSSLKPKHKVIGRADLSDADDDWSTLPVRKRASTSKNKRGVAVSGKFMLPLKAVQSKSGGRGVSIWGDDTSANSGSSLGGASTRYRPPPKAERESRVRDGYVDVTEWKVSRIDARSLARGVREVERYG